VGDNRFPGANPSFDIVEPTATKREQRL